MEIFIPKYNSIKLRGYVRVDVYHPEDIKQMEPIFKDEGENTIAGNLLERIVDHVDNTTNGTSTYFLSTASWHDDAHGYWDQSDDHEQENNHGIHIDANASCPDPAGSTQAFFLISPTITQPNTTTGRWVAESTWNGTNDDGSGATGSITKAYMGKYWAIGADNASSNSHGAYNWPYADYTVSAFTMQVADKIKITWDITVDA